MNSIFTFLSIVLAMMTSCVSAQWDRVEHLDPKKKFQLSWNITENNTAIVFEMLVNTTGWAGIGISAGGDMVGADIHVGWVKDGVAYVTDRHGGDFNGFPPLDEKQDLTLIGGWECEKQTSITFRRQLAACDADQDRPITRNSIRLIFAYSDADPSNTSLQPHDIHQYRGAKSLLLFEKSKIEIFDDEEDVKSFTLLNDGSPMPRADTYYHCLIIQLPALEEKHHVIRIEPVIEEGNERYVHHMTVSMCPPVLQNPSQVGQGANCYGGTLADWRYCLHIMAGWAVGSGAMTFPNNVGLPIGLPGQSRFISLTIHYNNFLHEDIRDHSGFRFVYTRQLREIDAGMLVLSHYLAGYNLVVPPDSSSFDAHATCGPACMSGAMDAVKVTSINIMGAFLHTHLTGRKVSLRHIRNGTELPPISSDETYDYDFQETRIISPSRKLLRGDHLQVSCTFSTKGSNKLVEGGLSINEEMCSAFLYYYPQIPLFVCNSAPAHGLDTVNKILGVDSVTEVNASPLYFFNRFRNQLITSPEKMANQTLDVAINNFSWTDKERKRLSEGFRDDSLRQLCVGPQPRVPFETVIPPLQINVPFSNSTPQLVCVRKLPSLTSRPSDQCFMTSR